MWKRLRTFNWNSFLPVVIDFFFNSNKDEGRNVWFLSCRIYIPFRKFCETTVELNSDKYAVKLNKSVKSWYQMSLSIYQNEFSIIATGTISLSVFYMESYDTICTQQPNKWKHVYYSGLALTVPIFDIGSSLSDAFMRPRRAEIRKQPTFTMETSTHDFSLFKKEKQMSAVLKPLSWV